MITTYMRYYFYIFKMTSKTYEQRHKVMAVSEENWRIIRNLGHCGDSFDDVLTDILKKAGVEVAIDHNSKEELFIKN
jgi:hypothetical protein